jgi:hypothetical protein
MMKNKAADTNSPAQQGTKLIPPVSAPPPQQMSLAGAFDQIEPLTDFQKNANAQTANQALAKLDSITLLAQSDSDKVHIWLLQAESHFVLSEEARGTAKKREKDAGCAILKDHEGKASDSRFKGRFDGFLHGDPKIGIAAIC